VKKLIIILAMLASPAFSQEATPSPTPAPEAPATLSAEPETSPAPTAAPADEIVPLDEAVAATAALVKDYKGMGKLGGAVALLNLLIMLLKTQLLGGWFNKRSPMTKRAILVAAGQALGILLAIEGGMGPLSAVIGGLITSGGAMAIYESVKPFLKKKAAS